MLKISIPENCVKITNLRLQARLPGPNELNGTELCVIWVGSSQYTCTYHPYRQCGTDSRYYWRYTLGSTLSWTQIPLCRSQATPCRTQQWGENHHPSALWKHGHLKNTMKHCIVSHDHHSVNSLWPSEAIWWHRSRPTLAKIMVCCTAITRTNVDLSSVKSSDNHLWAISQDIPQPSITKIILKITYLKFHSNFPGANEWTRSDY